MPGILKFVSTEDGPQPQSAQKEQETCPTESTRRGVPKGRKNYSLALK